MTKLNERGVVSLEFALLFPMLLLVTVVAVHFGLLYNASLAADDAAGEALTVLLELGGTEAAAEQRGTFVLTNDPSLSSQTGAVVANRDAGGGMGTVDVVAYSHGLLPGLPTKVTAHAEGPIELFVPQNER